MKFPSADFVLIRRSVLAACISALLCAGVLYSSHRYTEHAQQDRVDAQRLMDEAQNRLTTARQDRENRSVYASEYGALEENRIIGDEQRLDWIEGLEKLRLKNLVTDFRYNIAPQKSYTAIPAVDSGNFLIRYSEMKLQFDLLHEQQLMDFFEALHNQVKGRYQLAGCVLQRGIPDASGYTPLKAECSGGWITLQNHSAAQ